MRKAEFLNELEAGLVGLPKEDVEERLAFYSEMIDDRMEEGLTEEAPVAAAGPVDDIVSQILSGKADAYTVFNKIQTTANEKWAAMYA